jgi:two-component system, LytTR family, sensor kinase
MARYQQHLAFWLAYIVFKVYMNLTASVPHFDLLPEVSFELLGQEVVRQLTLLIVQVPFVYAVLYFLNRLLAGRASSLTVFSQITGLFVIGAISMSALNNLFILPYLLDYNESQFSIFSVGSLVYYTFLLAFVAGLAATLKLLRWQRRAQAREMLLQKERLDTELKFLKSQVNPHFLFNTLNNIYGLLRKKSDAAGDSVLKLSKLMRYMLFEANKSNIRLGDEVRLIEDYISLERLRYSERADISFTQSIDDPDCEIAPLLLIHFVENAFKHGVSESVSECFVNIEVHLKNGLLTAVIANSIPPANSFVSKEAIGMENTKRQLELVYPKHQLDVTKSHETFSVTLTIPLPERT